MDWGILQGLGQGLQTVGTSMREEDEEKRRAKMAEQLEKDREKRAEDRLAARPDPKQTTYEEGEGGVTWKVSRNSAGTELERVLAPKTDIDRIKKDTEKENLSIEGLRAQIEASKATTEGKKKEMMWDEEDRTLMSPEERAASMRVKGGLAPSADTKYSTDGSLQRVLLTGSKKDEDEADNTTMADYAKSYLDNNPAVIADYVDSKKLTEHQAQAAVMRVLQAFSQRGIKPKESDFRLALEAYAKTEAKNKPESGGIKLNLTGQ